MQNELQHFDNWIEKEARRQSYFSATFWFLFSTLNEREFAATLDLHDQTPNIPFVKRSTTVRITKRTGAIVQAEFGLLPLPQSKVYILISLDKPGRALRPMYRLLARSRGRIQLFPFGHPVIRSCMRLSSAFSLEETHVLRGVSYPSRPNEGGADINLRPGNALAFFARVEEEKRIVKTTRVRAPASERTFSEFSIGRAGYLTYYKGEFTALRELMTEKLAGELSGLVRPFEQAKGRFVEFRFSEPLFVGRENYSLVIQALSRLPRTSVALLHKNPYFHATLTNYEDGGEFDIFITGHSSVHVQGQGEVSPASFLRIQDGLTELFRDASISLEKAKQYTVRQLMDGQL